MENIKETNKNLLSQFKGVYIKRIIRDCESLYEIYPNLVLSNNSDKIEMIITEGKEKYGFVFNNTYPFTPPKIYYNGESYMELLRINDKCERNILRKYRNKECLCCDSYDCYDNWKPLLTLKIIIDEIKEIVQLKKTIVHVLLAEKIKKKYLIDDIDIISYLI